MDSYYTRAGDEVIATGYSRGPWDERAQHGGPPSALLLHEMDQALADAVGEGFAVSRLTCEFLRPVPVGRLRVAVDAPVGGRFVQRVTARLLDGDKVVLAARGVWMRQDEDVPVTPHVRAGADDGQWPAPSDVAPFVFPFFAHDMGYHRSVELRLVDAPWGSTPVRCWARPVVGLFEDVALSPAEACVVLADAESGIGPPCDPMVTTYLNPDLTVYFARAPRSGYVGLDIRSRVGPAGVGLSATTLRDEQGVFGHCAQSLLLMPRRA